MGVNETTTVLSLLEAVLEHSFKKEMDLEQFWIFQTGDGLNLEFDYALPKDKKIFKLMA